MKKIIFICLVSLLQFSIKAQMVTIPDANFVTYLQANFPGCMTGNQLDTNCAANGGFSIMVVSNLNISDLTGIQYFHSLTDIYCDSNTISFIPSLASLSALSVFHCQYNNLTTLPVLPSGIYDLNCSFNQLTSLPLLPSFLNQLVVNDNNIQCH